MYIRNLSQKVFCILMLLALFNISAFAEIKKENNDVINENPDFNYLQTLKESTEELYGMKFNSDITWLESDLDEAIYSYLNSIVYTKENDNYVFLYIYEYLTHKIGRAHV